MTCTILAAAGPQRSRVLATLYKVNNPSICAWEIDSHYTAGRYTDILKHGLGWTMLEVKNLSYITKGSLSPSLSLSHTHTQTHTLSPYCTNISVFIFMFFHPQCLPSFINGNLVWIYQVYLERILRKPEIDAFSEELKAHQVKTSFPHCLLMLPSLDYDLWLVPFCLFNRKHFCQTISLYWIVLWLSTIFWVQANCTQILGWRCNGLGPLGLPFPLGSLA